MPSDRTVRSRRNRREFLALAMGLPAWMGIALAGEDRESGPRAISGDDREPRWEERLTLTVGVSGGDLSGVNEKAIQAAIEVVEQLGGGTVKLLPGTYRLRDAIRLRSGVRLVGSGPETVLFKEPSVTIPLAADADWYDQEVLLPEGPEARSLKVGDGLCLMSKRESGDAIVLKRTIVARSGSRVKLDRPFRENLWKAQEARAATVFPILDGDGVSDIAIEDLTLDGNRANNAYLDGNYGGALFLQDCNRVGVRRVVARNYNGDGMSWQISHDVTVEGCQVLDNATLGLHPGSGSQRPVIRDNLVRSTDIGIFFCWGVRHGVAEKNRIEDVRKHGISIGHRDTDNLIRDNDVLRSGINGVLFRKERVKSFAPHRNRVEANRIVDNGPDGGVAVDVQGETEAVVLARNEIRDTRTPTSRTGIRISPTTRDLTLAENRLEGFKRDVEDGRDGGR